MAKDLTNSAVDRQNILNNRYALAEIEKAAGIRGIPFEGKTVVLKEQVAMFFEVTLRTVENYLEQNAEELARNGYEVVTGNRLKLLKLAVQDAGDPETNFGITAKTVRLGVLDFRAFLNLAMLMTESSVPVCCARPFWTSSLTRSTGVPVAARSISTSATKILFARPS